MFGTNGVRGARLAKALLIALFAAVVSGCGGDPNPKPVPVPQPLPSPSPQSTAPEVRLARQLAVNPVTRTTEITPVSYPVNEPAALFQTDLNLTRMLYANVIPDRYSATLSRLASRTQINGLNAQVVNDLACSPVPFGGGIAGADAVYLDGKLLDLMADIANGLAMKASGRLSASLSQIVDTAAAQQLSFANFCVPSAPLAFPDAMLTPAELDRSVEIFTQLAGGILFHEFGHVWARHTLLQLRDSIINPQGGFFAYTSATEDNADVISGVLSAKANHESTYPKMMIDLMTFAYFYRRSPGAVFFDQALTWQAQLQQMEPKHSSSAQRKMLIDLGFSGWARK
ncbi:hypothetical protein [Aquabacterium sp.]|uniref:hypothetical protein n=1 Tax=Aquabacterium sp. TaxID=1872578 RepID=UPI002E31E655|nr:hypothetical protein [Aquabacterium sp.]HEX5312284.1 hypothetical protein [Aquabacterium sp.]